MNRPEDFELTSFFGVEPDLRVPDAPWDFNGLTFKATRGVEQVSCHIEMDVGAVSIRWQSGDDERLALELKWVDSICLVRSTSGDALLMNGVAQNPDVRVELQLDPMVFVRVHVRPKHP